MATVLGRASLNSVGRIGDVSRLFTEALTGAAPIGASIVMRHQGVSGQVYRLWAAYYGPGPADATPSPCRGHQGRPHRSMMPSRGARLRSNMKGAIASKRIRPSDC